MIYAAALLIVAGVALFVAAPLVGGVDERAGESHEREIEGRERQRELAVQALGELEFDREMGKLNDSDYSSLKHDLEGRALQAMGALERLISSKPASSSPVAQRSQAPHPAASKQDRRGPLVRFCPQCGKRAGQGAKFCAHCGAPLRGLRRSVS